MSKKNEETKSPDKAAQEHSGCKHARFSSDKEDDDTTPTDRVSCPVAWFFLGWMMFASYYPTTENKAADRAMGFLGIKEPTEVEKKKLGRSTARVGKAKTEEFERTRDNDTFALLRNICKFCYRDSYVFEARCMFLERAPAPGQIIAVFPIKNSIVCFMLCINFYCFVVSNVGL